MILPDRLVGDITLDLEGYDPYLMEYGPGWAFADKKFGFIAGVAIKAENFREYIPIAHEGSPANQDPATVMRWLSHVLGNPEQRKILANAVYDLGWLRRYGVEVAGFIDDVLVQAPLLDEYRDRYGLDYLGADYLDERKDYAVLEEEAKLLGIDPKKVMMNIHKLSPETVGQYALQDIDMTYSLWKLFSEKIKEEELEQVYELECNLIPILLDMRWNGVRVNVDQAERLSGIYERIEMEAIAEIKRRTGVEISPWQATSVAEALMAAGVEVPLTPKTKKPSVKKEWLATLTDPVGSLILDVRRYNKVRTTFLDKAILEHSFNGRIHATFNQLKADRPEGGGKGTVGGRFSSDHPNLQQMPARDGELGPVFRTIFLPEEDAIWAALDYSSQEPRILSSFAGLCQVRGGEDIVRRYNENPDLDFHQYTADVTGLTRKESKPVGLGLAYGMGGGKLAFTLGLPYTLDTFRGREIMKAGAEAEAVLRKFNDGAPFIKALSEYCKKIAGQRGFIRTPTGRKLRFPMVGRERFYLHKALNRLIQGTAACQTKTAMVEMHKEKIHLLVTVHDELGASVESEAQARQAAEIMRTCFPLEVPSKVDIELGKSWGHSMLGDDAEIDDDGKVRKA